MNKHILEKIEIVSGFVPINIGTARTGDVVSLKNYGRIAVVFFKDAGVNNEDATLTIQQAKSVAPSSAKNINFTRVDTKQAAALTSVGTWTQVDQAAGTSYTNTDAGGQQAIWVVDIKAEDLDVDNGYDCIYASVGDAGTATSIAALFYILHEPRYTKAGGVSAIVD